jgi:hypothetical protein
MKLSIPIISKDAFRKMLLEHIVEDKKDWSVENIMDSMITDGFPKLDFDRLNDCLSKIFIYLPTVAVEIGDNRFVWVVSGNNAMLVQKEPFGKP